MHFVKVYDSKTYQKIQSQYTLVLVLRYMTVLVYIMYLNFIAV